VKKSYLILLKRQDWQFCECKVHLCASVEEAVIWAKRCHNGDMRNVDHGGKSISIYSEKGYGMVKYYFNRTLNPISKNRDFLAKIQGRQIWNIGVYRRTSLKKEYKLYLNRDTTFSFLGLGEVMLRKNVGNKSNEKSIYKN